MDFAQFSTQVSDLLSRANGLALTQSRLTRDGIEMIFEAADTRVEVRIVPKVYTAGKVIVDAINDLTITVEVKKFQLGHVANGTPSAQKIFEEHVELPYSTWFTEGDYR